jgi:peptidoglycan hydrolase-like protein with peptidoglycan-binding domain
MALTSPRFAANQRLQQAAASMGNAIRRGARGAHVAAVQKAFIDLGFVMNITASKGAPDGIFGGETESRIWQFQAQTGLTRHGVIGPEILAKLDALLPTSGPPPTPLPPVKMTHKLNIHMRSIDNPTVPEFTQLKVMEQVFAQYFIRIDVLSGQSIGLSPDETLTLEIIDGACKWDQVSDEQRLLQNSGSKQGVGPNDITVYFATVIRTGKTTKGKNITLQGCAGHAPDRPAVMIAATAIDKTTMAHEVCHVLLGSSFDPVHTDDNANLMCAAPVCTGRPAHLTVKQLDRILASKFVHPI